MFINVLVSYYYEPTHKQTHILHANWQTDTPMSPRHDTNKQTDIIPSVTLSGKTYYIANNDWFKGSGGIVNNGPIIASGSANNGS